jgi:hypothetical protein
VAVENRGFFNNQQKDKARSGGKIGTEQEKLRNKINKIIK